MFPLRFKRVALVKFVHFILGIQKKMLALQQYKTKHFIPFLGAGSSRYDLDGLGRVPSSDTQGVASSWDST